MESGNLAVWWAHRIGNNPVRRKCSRELSTEIEICGMLLETGCNNSGILKSCHSGND